MTKQTLLSIGLTLILSLLLVSVALAVPPLPYSPYGTATINGVDAAPGTLVSAWCNGTEMDTFAVEAAEGDTWYSVKVPGDDPDTPEVSGCPAGETVTFQIGASWADQTGTWASGDSPRLDLTASTPGSLLYLPLIVR